MFLGRNALVERLEARAFFRRNAFVGGLEACDEGVYGKCRGNLGFRRDHFGDEMLLSIDFWLATRTFQWINALVADRRGVRSLRDRKSVV